MHFKINQRSAREKTQSVTIYEKDNAVARSAWVTIRSLLVHPLPYRSTTLQNGTDDDDFLTAATMAADGSSVFFGGYTTGDWYGTNAGAEDFAALQLDADGTVLWKWQV